MPKLQRDTWSKFGNEVGAELNLLFSAAASLGVTPSPNTRTKQTSTGTILEFVNRDGAKATDGSEAEVTEQWFKLVKPETGTPTGYKLPEWYDDAGNQITPPSDYVTYGNRRGLNVRILWSNDHWVTQSGLNRIRDYIQLDEVAGLGLPCDKDGNLISGREEEYTWIAPPPIPINCLLAQQGYWPWWETWHWRKPIYKYGNTIEECTGLMENTRVGDYYRWDVFWKPIGWEPSGNTLSHLHYPCFNELYGNGTWAESDVGNSPNDPIRKKLLLMYGWDYWRSLYIDSRIEGVGGGVEYPPHRFRPPSRELGLDMPTNIIKAVKLSSPIKFGSQNAATEVIECNWLDRNEAGRVWTAVNNYLEQNDDWLPFNTDWDAIFPRYQTFIRIAMFAQDNNGYYLHNRHTASNLIKRIGFSKTS